MRRIYESGAVDRDDRNPYQPNERDATTTPQAMRTVPAETLSRHLVPHRLRSWGISVDVSTPKDTYEVGNAIPFVVTLKNVLPFPIAIPTNSPLVWNWHVDGFAEASQVTLETPPDRDATFSFARGERKRFHKRWDQMFRIGKHEWEPAAPDQYTISACIDVDNPKKRDLHAETTVRIE